MSIAMSIPDWFLEEKHPRRILLSEEARVVNHEGVEVMLTRGTMIEILGYVEEPPILCKYRSPSELYSAKDRQEVFRRLSGKQLLAKLHKEERKV